MKDKIMFVRTENGIYEVVEEIESAIDNKVVGYNCYFNYCDEQRVDFVPMVDVIKASKNVEELCDKVILKEIDVIILNKEHTQYRFEDGEEWFDITETEIEKGIYGAIWTKRGLIYVAKMNENGEWELC